MLAVTTFIVTCRAVVGQVYVAEPGYVLGRAAVPKFAIITSLAGIATPDLMTFASVLCGLAHGARAPLEYYTFSERHRRKSTILQVRLLDATFPLMLC
jgi:hypothetical protein